MSVPVKFLAMLSVLAPIYALPYGAPPPTAKATAIGGGMNNENLSPKDCVIDDAKRDECEEILKDDHPNRYVFCRNSDQNDLTSLKVCTFTHVNDNTTHATSSPTVENKQCVVSKDGGSCDKVCKGLWLKGFLNSETKARFTYSLGKSYDCVFKTTTTRDEKLTCGCAHLALATRQNE